MSKQLFFAEFEREWYIRLHLNQRKAPEIKQKESEHNCSLWRGSGIVSDFSKTDFDKNS